MGRGKGKGKGEGEGEGGGGIGERGQRGSNIFISKNSHHII